MTDRLSAVPNTRSPGTPVCHPNDAYDPRTFQEPINISIGRQLTNLAHGSEYVELHAASAFSFLAGASQPEALIERAAELDMPAIAIADRNSLYGVARFHTAAK
jgi:DNA polymerase III alpha subunit (gram-positive type)